MNFSQIVKKLQMTRPVFHSEDDLKLAMAMIINKLYPTYQIRLERPTEVNMQTRNGIATARAPIDFVVLDPIEKRAYPIEIKYTTKKAILRSDDETFSLTNHGANDIRRYSFRKDIYRVENVKIENYTIKQGFVFILTNDKGYYQNDVSSKNSLAANFSFHHGVVLSKDYTGWNLVKIPEDKYDLDLQETVDANKKRHWTLGKQYVYQLGLKSDYLIQWCDYSTFALDKGIIENFKYCLIEVEG